MIRVAAPYRAAFARLGLNTAPAVLQHFAAAAAEDGQSVQVRPVSLELAEHHRIPAFLKIYRHVRPGWRYWGRRSKAAGEFANLHSFAQLGIRCAEPIACGEQRDRFGRLVLALIITAAIPSAWPCSDWLLRQTPLHGSRRRRLVLQELAEQLRRLHDAGRVHRDCFLRNILITDSSESGLQAWWIDCPHGSPVPWARWRWDYRCKDLASLDRLGRERASTTERLRFLRHYLGPSTFRRDGKRLARRVLSYGLRRWGNAGANQPA